MLFFKFILALGLSSTSVWASCPPSLGGAKTRPQQDILLGALSAAPECPRDVGELKDLLKKGGLNLKPSIVANRGRNNSEGGSFSFFETDGEGRFYLGHFTGVNSHGELDLDQLNAPGKLLIELIAWDFEKKLFNFYELIGSDPEPRWIYRGDSSDILADNTLLNRQKNPNAPQFGARLRCSACHTSGGPIMKEWDAPHNDWWTASRHLIFSSPLTDSFQNILAQVNDAADFSNAVQKGVALLTNSPALAEINAKRDFKEVLRPLFCTDEINLVSDATANELNQDLQLPSDIWVNPILLPTQSIKVSRTDYNTAMQQLGFEFPENGAPDADHGWLAPVKGRSDLFAIEKLVADKVVDEEFVADVLAVDFAHPLFSANRCGLLKHVPNKASPTWKEALQENLRAAASMESQVLLSNLLVESRTTAFHKQEALNFIQTLKVGDLASVKAELIRLDELRKSVFAHEISQNPRGQILEPGFRVIFPVRRN